MKLSTRYIKRFKKLACYLRMTYLKCDGQTGWRHTQWWDTTVVLNGSPETEFLPLQYTQYFLQRPSADEVHTYPRIMEVDILYLKSTYTTINHILKTPAMLFDQITGHYNVTKLIHKVKYHTNQCFSFLFFFFLVGGLCKITYTFLRTGKNPQKTIVSPSLSSICCQWDHRRNLWLQIPSKICKHILLINTAFCDLSFHFTHVMKAETMSMGGEREERELSSEMHNDNIENECLSQKTAK